MAILTIEQLPWEGPDYLIPWETWSTYFNLDTTLVIPPEFVGVVFFQVQNTSMAVVDFTVTPMGVLFNPPSKYYQMQPGETLSGESPADPRSDNIFQGLNFAISGAGLVLKQIYLTPPPPVPFWANSRGQREVL